MSIQTPDLHILHAFSCHLNQSLFYACTESDNMLEKYKRVACSTIILTEIMMPKFKQVLAASTPDITEGLLNMTDYQTYH